VHARAALAVCAHGAARIFSRQDLGQCAPSVVAGVSYLASAWYQSTETTRFTFWYRDNNGGWRWWTQSPQFAASSTWAQATWVTPPVPSDATALSFGLDLSAVGSLTTDDYILSRQQTGRCALGPGPWHSPALATRGPAGQQPG
jgi:hypothetical protein